MHRHVLSVVLFLRVEQRVFTVNRTDVSLEQSSARVPRSRVRPCLLGRPEGLIGTASLIIQYALAVGGAFPENGPIDSRRLYELLI